MMLCCHQGLVLRQTALHNLLVRAAPLPAETVPLESASGRVLAASVLALRARPAHDLAAMDGYAVREEDLSRMRQGLLVRGAAYPGAPFGQATQPGEAVRITTGARLPVGADCVVITEATSHDADHVRLVGDPGESAHVRRAGSELRPGEILVERGAVLTAPALMVAAAAEAGAVQVVRRPRVALVVTGDEIAQTGLPPGEDQIPDCISVPITALVRAWGGEIDAHVICRNQQGSLIPTLTALKARCDVIVVIGGASGGERDLARAAAQACQAETLFAGVAIKPGRSIWAAAWPSGFVLGLPGNPIAALITARLFLTPLVAELAGLGAAAAMEWRQGRVLEDLPANGGRELFLLSRMIRPDALSLLDHQGGSVRGEQSLLDALARVPPRGGLPRRAEYLVL